MVGGVGCVGGDFSQTRPHLTTPDPPQSFWFMLLVCLSMLLACDNICLEPLIAWASNEYAGNVEYIRANFEGNSSRAST